MNRSDRNTILFLSSGRKREELIGKFRSWRYLALINKMKAYSETGGNEMKKIVLLCAAGMSTSMMVNRMRAAAQETGYDCEINAYAMSEAKEVGSDADMILLGPQVRFSVEKIRQECPNVPVEATPPSHSLTYETE